MTKKNNATLKATPPPAPTVKATKQPPVAISTKSLPSPKTAKPSPPPPPAPNAPLSFVYQRSILFTCEKLRQLLNTCASVAVHFEFINGDERKCVAIAVLYWSTTTSKTDAENTMLPAWVMHEDITPLDTFVALLRIVLTEGSAVKIVHDMHALTRWLSLDPIMVANFVDLQYVYGIHVNPLEQYASLAAIAKHYGVPYNEAVSTNSNEFKQELMKHMIPHKIIQTLVKTAKVLSLCYEQSVTTISNGSTKPPVRPPPTADATSTPSTEVATPIPSTAVETSTTPAAVPTVPFTYQIPSLFSCDKLRQLLTTCVTVAIHFELINRPESESQRVIIATLYWTTNKLDEDAPVSAWVIHENGTSIRDFGVLMHVLLSEGSAVKIVHGLRPVAHWLSEHGLETLVLNNVVDLQLMYEVHVNPLERNASMAAVSKQCGVPAATYSEVVSLNLSEFKKELLKQLLGHKTTQTLIKKSKILSLCYEQGVATTLSTAHQLALYEMTARRWTYASRYDGNPVIWFDDEYVPRSLEILGSEADLAETIPTLQLQCEIGSLLALLPDRYRDAVLAIDNAQDRLVDIILDVGRIPHGYTGFRQRIMLEATPPLVASSLATHVLHALGTSVPSLPSHRVVPEDLAIILERLGGEGKIGSDNRAGVDRQLHRISVMRDKNEGIYGLTMRVGRTLQYASNFLLDLLLCATHRQKSVLLLGRPGSGKTTLIRDIARCIADSSENVCIIDTSNEIGGDGVVPHECIGWARRMMVTTLNDQARVMVECVQNHTVETMIIDEIGRKAEVDAAGTVRQRGPRIIASAHGDFRSLIKNQDLKGLIGGVQQVIVGDKEASKHATLGKLQTKRAGNPIFDVIVELDEVHRGRCRIIWDVGQAVDNVLNGDTDYAFETRFQTFGVRGVQVLKH